jgi:hypothetical protein
MSQTKPHKITVRNREGQEDLTTKGTNVQVLLDGEPLKFCKYFKFEVVAGGMARVTLEMYAAVELDIVSELEKSEPKPVEGQDKWAIYELSSPFPIRNGLESEIE